MTTDTQTIRPMLDFDGFTIPLPPDRATELLTATAAFQHTVTTHNLPAGSVEITPASPGSKEWNPAVEWGGKTDGWTLPVQPTIRVRLGHDMAGFYRWCEVIAATTVRVERDLFHTQLNARVRADGLTWEVAGELHRPAKPHPHLPGIPAPWVRENGRLTDWGRISLADLRTVLDRLGVDVTAR